MAQKTLRTKKKRINDEFYTQYNDIEHVIDDITQEDPFIFNNSDIICPCDSEDSEIVKFFYDNISNLNLREILAIEFKKGRQHGKWKKIISSSMEQVFQNPVTSPLDDIPSFLQKIYMPSTGYLSDDGDFRNAESIQRMKQSDFIITNPPFSLARDFFRILLSLNKRFVILGNLNMINYKELIPSIVKGDIFVSHTAFNQGMKFTTSEGNSIRIPSIVWFTNIDFPKRHEFLSRKLLIKKENENIYANITAYRNLYRHYDNYTNIIEVPRVSMIPKDYHGLMGVPITFIGRHCPEEFDIKWIIGGNVISFTDENLLKSFGYHPDKKDKGGCPMINGKRIYSRIIIQLKKQKIG